MNYGFVGQQPPPPTVGPKEIEAWQAANGINGSEAWILEVDTAGNIKPTVVNLLEGNQYESQRPVIGIFLPNGFAATFRKPEDSGPQPTIVSGFVGLQMREAQMLEAQNREAQMREKIQESAKIQRPDQVKPSRSDEVELVPGYNSIPHGGWPGHQLVWRDSLRPGERQRQQRPGGRQRQQAPKAGTNWLVWALGGVALVGVGVAIFAPKWIGLG